MCSCLKNFPKIELDDDFCVKNNLYAFTLQNGQPLNFPNASLYFQILRPSNSADVKQTNGETGGPTERGEIGAWEMDNGASVLNGALRPQYVI